MPNGPLTITILAWLFIATGTVAMAIQLKERAARPIFQFEELWSQIVALLSTVFGALILLSQKLGAMACGFIPRGEQVLRLMAKGVGRCRLAALIEYILFRPTVRSYLY